MVAVSSVVVPMVHILQQSAADAQAHAWFAEHHHLALLIFAAAATVQFHLEDVLNAVAQFKK